jgi:hypothetical protein
MRPRWKTTKSSARSLVSIAVAVRSVFCAALSWTNEAATSGTPGGHEVADVPRLHEARRYVTTYGAEWQYGRSSTFAS